MEKHTVKSIKVRAFIESIGEFRDIAVNQFDTAYEFKYRCLKDSIRPEDLVFFRVIFFQVCINWNGKIKREIDDFANLLEAITNEEASGSGGGMGKIVLIVRNTSQFTRIRIGPNRNNNNGNSSSNNSHNYSELYEVVPTLGCNPWPVNVFGCTEWIYQPFPMSFTSSPYFAHDHLKSETFNENLFRVLSDVGSKHGVLERLNHGSDKSGYYILTDNTLWVYRIVAGLEKPLFTSINNIISADVSSENPNAFVMKYICGKEEEEVVLTCSKDKVQSRDWITSVNSAGSVKMKAIDNSSEDRSDNYMFMVEQMIGNYELKKTEEFVDQMPKYRNILYILGNNQLRRKFISMGSKYVRYLQFWEAAEDWTITIKDSIKETDVSTKLRNDEILRFQAICRTFLDSTSDFYLDKCNMDICARICGLDVSKELIKVNIFAPLQLEVMNILKSSLSNLIADNIHNIKVMDNKSDISFYDVPMDYNHRKNSTKSNSSTASIASPESPGSMSFWGRLRSPSQSPSPNGNGGNRLQSVVNSAITNSKSGDSSGELANSDVGGFYSSQTSTPTSKKVIPSTPSAVSSSLIFKDWKSPSLRLSFAPQGWWDETSERYIHLSTKIKRENRENRENKATSGSGRGEDDDISSILCYTETLNFDNPDIDCLPHDTSSMLSWIFSQPFLQNSESSNKRSSTNNDFAADNADPLPNSYSEMFGLGNIVKVGEMHAKYIRKSPKKESISPFLFSERGKPTREYEGSIIEKYADDGSEALFEKDRSPSDDFTSPAMKESNTVDKFRYTTLVLSTSLLNESKLTLIVNNIITAIIHLKNVVKIRFDVQDPRMFILEDLHGVSWSFRADAIDDLDALEQCKLWHQVLCDVIPAAAAREYIECSGYFSKRGRINKAYRKRWFILVFDTNNNWSLRYYKEKRSPIFKGETKMRTITKVECDFPVTQNYNRDRPPPESRNTNFFSFGLSKSKEYKIILFSNERVWDLMSDSLPIAEFWYHMFVKVVLYNESTQPGPKVLMRNSVGNIVGDFSQGNFDNDLEDEDEDDDDYVDND